MDKITKQETIEALKKLFDYESHKEKKEVIVAEHDYGATFMIDKRYLERYEVIERLQNFFADKVIDGGQCRIDSITLLYTSFFIEHREV